MRTALNRRDVLKRAAGLAAAPLLTSNTFATSNGSPMLRGVSLAGAEFGQLVPGQIGRDYIYPGLADFEFCAAQGFNVVRLPFKWERLQPDLNRPFDSTEWQHLSRAIATARKLRLKLILDPHNYARRRVRDDDFTVDHLIGSDQVPTWAFVSFWRQFAGLTTGDDHVIYGLMNEPFEIAPDAWLGIANEVVAAIREGGSRQLVLVPGTAYSGAHSWIEAGNTVLDGVRDPDQHFAIEVHQYLDNDSSGRSGVTASETVGVERLKDFQSWARGHGIKAFLGEFGAGAEATGVRALELMVREVEKNKDVWIGWTAWAAGPWWPDSEPLRLSPDSGGHLPPQTKVLSNFARGKS